MNIRSQFSTYLVYFAISAAVMLAMAGGFNWLINPFGIYNSPVIRGVNIPKPEIDDHSRMYKAYIVRKIKPQAIILGSSRAEESIDPDHPGWSYSPVYNLAFDNARMYEIAGYFHYANSLQPLKQVLLTLDFFAFDTVNTKELTYSEDRIAVRYDGQKNPTIIFSDINETLFSLDALVSSFKTVFQSQEQNWGRLDNGMHVPLSQKEKYATHKKFVNLAKYFIVSEYIPEQYQFDLSHVDTVPFEAYRKMLRIAYQDNIDLRMTILPCHVLHWETLGATDLWQKNEDWKRILVAINDEESQLAGKPPFPLWDFSNYNELTTENVPPNDTWPPMRWYLDPSHFTKEFGDLMLDEIFDYHAMDRPVQEKLGVLLTTNNIEQHLAQINKDRENYRYTHPDDIAEIENLVKELEATPN